MAAPVSSLPLAASLTPEPVSPAQSDNSNNNNNQAQTATGPVRRKTSRRANTAERRATHNAVERQRRETLNGRFLDLAALLPNLASVRRPSKSAIVNSSIALIHTQRRSRALAGRELRLLKAETDALRRELNEWRDRASLPRVDEPGRSVEFQNLMVLEEADESPEVVEEVRRAYEMAAIPMGGEDELEYGDYEAPAPVQQQQEFVQQVPVAPVQYQQQQQQRVSVHIPFDAQTTLFSEPQPMSAISSSGAPQQQQPWSQAYITPPTTSHGYAPYPRPQAQPVYTHGHRSDDDSSSSGSGSPPSTAAHFDHGHGQYHQQQVPTLAAGATPQDFARFWAPPTQQQQQQQMKVGYPLGFAM